MVSRDRERGQVKDEIGRRRMRVTSERRGPWTAMLQVLRVVRTSSLMNVHAMMLLISCNFPCSKEEDKGDRN